MRNFLSVAKMASLVYERENCVGASLLLERSACGVVGQLHSTTQGYSSTPSKISCGQGESKRILKNRLVGEFIGFSLR